MADFTGTPGNDSFTIDGPEFGTFSLDGLAGRDTVHFGQSFRSDFRITKSSDGAVHLDTISAASSPLHATLFNVEVLVFDSRRDKVEVATLFPAGPPPTVAISDNITGTARGSVTYTLTFSTAVTGLDTSDFSISNGTLISAIGSGASYSVVVAPAANFEGMLGLTLNAGAVTDSSGSANAAAAAAPQAVDTKAPAVSAFSPANGAGNIPGSSDIVVTFSEPIQRGSGAITVRDGSGAVVGSFDAASSGAIGIAGNLLTLNPSSDLLSGAHLSVEFAAGSVTDAVGNPALGNPFAGSGGSYGFVTAVNPANPVASGTLGNDVFSVVPGHESINGFAGLDSVALPLPRAAYSVTQTASGFTIAATGSANIVDLTSVERALFSDSKLAFDLDGHAGQTAKILGAVLGAAAVANREYAGVGLQLLDGGMSYEALIQLALNFKLGPGATNTQVVDLLYTNVVGVAPPPADEAFYVGLLNDHSFTQASLGVLAADTDLNKAHIDLVGLAHTGLPYIGG